MLTPIAAAAGRPARLAALGRAAASAWPSSAPRRAISAAATSPASPRWCRARRCSGWSSRSPISPSRSWTSSSSAACGASPRRVFRRWSANISRTRCCSAIRASCTSTPGRGGGRPVAGGPAGAIATGAPFGAIKDVAILSALVGNFVTLTMFVDRVSDAGAAQHGPVGADAVHLDRRPARLVAGRSCCCAAGCSACRARDLAFVAAMQLVRVLGGDGAAGGDVEPRPAGGAVRLLADAGVAAPADLAPAAGAEQGRRLRRRRGADRRRAGRASRR